MTKVRSVSSIINFLCRVPRLHRTLWRWAAVTIVKYLCQPRPVTVVIFMISVDHARPVTAVILMISVDHARPVTAVIFMISVDHARPVTAVIFMISVDHARPVTVVIFMICVRQVTAVTLIISVYSYTSIHSCNPHDLCSTSWSCNPYDFCLVMLIHSQLYPFWFVLIRLQL